MARSKWKGVNLNKKIVNYFLLLKKIEKKQERRKVIINNSHIVPTFFFNKQIYVYNGCKLQKIFIQNFKIGYNVNFFLTTKKIKNFRKKVNGSKI